MAPSMSYAGARAGEVPGGTAVRRAGGAEEERGVRVRQAGGAEVRAHAVDAGRAGLC
jgi:hypothetical protein